MQYFSSLNELTCSMVIFALVSAEFNSTVSEIFKVLRLQQQWDMYSTYYKMDDELIGFYQGRARGYGHITQFSD